MQPYTCPDYMRLSSLLGTADEDVFIPKNLQISSLWTWNRVQCLQDQNSTRKGIQTQVDGWWFCLKFAAFKDEINLKSGNSWPPRVGNRAIGKPCPLGGQQRGPFYVWGAGAFLGNTFEFQEGRDAVRRKSQPDFCRAGMGVFIGSQDSQPPDKKENARNEGPDFQGGLEEYTLLSLVLVVRYKLQGAKLGS